MHAQPKQRGSGNSQDESSEGDTSSADRLKMLFGWRSLWPIPPSET
jgi:hypothetical protein